MAGKAKIGAVIALDGEKEFKQSVAGCNKELSNLKSQSGLVKEEFEGQANTLEALKKKHEVLNKILEVHKKKEIEIENALKHAKESYDKVGDGIAILNKERDVAQKKLDDMKKSTSATSEEIEKQEKVVKELAQAIRKGEENYQTAANRIQDWETKLNTARTQTLKANKALDQNDKYMHEAQQSADKCAKSIDGYGKKVKESVEATLEFEEAIKVAAFEKGIDVLGQTMNALGEATLGVAQDMNASANQIQASTGISQEAVKNYSKVMEDVYKNNYGDNFEDVGEAISVITQNLGELDASNLQEMTESSITLRDTFGFDYQEQIRTVKMLMDTFGISSERAYNLIAQGAQNGLNKNGDLLDTINEYAVHYKQMGASADEFFNSLANGTASGTFSVDKLGDAYKEFGIRVKDTADSTTEGYKLLGLNADEMRAKFAAGGESAQSATATVVSALFNMNDQVKQNQAGVDLFGTMWEDLGLKGIEALTNLNGGISSTKNVMAEIQDIKYDDMTNQLTQISRLIQMQIAAPLASELFPEVKRGLEFTADNLDAVTTAMKGLGAIILLHKTTHSETFMKTTAALMKMTTATEGATLAQKALNLAQSMSPAGWLITIIGAVTAGLVAYKIATKDSTSELNEQYAQTKKLCDATDELTDSMKESQQSRQKAKDGIDAEYGAYQKMVDKLYELADKENKSNGEKAQMSALVDELNSKVPELNLQFNEQAGVLNKTKAEAESYIQSLKNMAMVQAAQEDYAEIMKERYEAEKNLSQLRMERNELTDKLQDSTEKMNEANEKSLKQIKETGETTIDVNLATKEYEATLTQCGGQIEALDEKIAEQEAALEASNEDLSLTEGILEKYGTATVDAASATDELTASQQEAGETALRMSEEQKEAYEEMRNAIETAVDSSLSAFDEFNGGTEISTGKVLENLTSQLNGISKWSDNLKTLAGAAGEGMTKEFYDYLVDMGPSSANLVQSLVNSLENNTGEFANVCQKWTEAMNLENSVSDSLAQTGLALESGMKGAFDQATVAAQSGSKQVVEATEQGLSKTPEATQNATKAATEQMSAEQENAKVIASENGKAIMTNMAAGMAFGTPAVVNAVKGAMIQSDRAADASYGEFQTTGSYLMEGLKAGIDAKASEIATATATAIRAALEAAKKEADIRSPSRKFKKEVGEQIGKGMAFGIKESSKLSEEEAKKMSAKVYTAAKSWLKKYKKNKDASIDDEIYYWKQVKKQLQKGTEEYEKAAKKIDNLKKTKMDIKSFNVSGGALDIYKTYYQVSAKAEMDYWETVRGMYKEGTANRLEADQKYLEAKESYKEQLEELNHEYYENTKAVNDKLAEDVQELTDTYNEAVKERSDAIYSSFGLFDQFESTSASGSVLLSNLKSQVAGYADWQLQLEELAEKPISQGLLGELKEMGPEASASLHALNSLTEEQLAEYDKLWQQKNELSQSQALKEMEELKIQTQNKIQALKDAAQQELNAYQATYESAVAELSTGMETPLAELAGKAKTWGEDTVRNYVASVKNIATSNSTTADLKTVSGTITTQLSTLEDSGKRIGKDTLQGLLDGITDKKKITSSAKQMVKMLKDAVKEAADIHSPSRLFKREIGEQLAAGVAEGITGNAKEVNHAGEDMIKSLLESEKQRIRASQVELSGYLQSINSANGMMELRNLISVAPVQQVNATVDNSELAYLFETMLSVIQNGFLKLQEMQVVLDTGEAVGSMSPAIGSELSMISRRRR